MADNDDSWLSKWRRAGYVDNDARYIRSLLSTYRRKLMSSANSSGRGTSAERLNRKRFAANKTQQRRRLFIRHTPLRLPVQVLARAHRRSDLLLDGLYPERSDKWRPVVHRATTVEEIDLRLFSFLHNPIETMVALRKIAEAESTAVEAHLNFHDSYCLDVGPFLLLQAMRRAMVPIFSGGSITRPVQTVLDIVGLRKALKMAFPPSNDSTFVWPFPFRSRRPSGSSTSDTRLLDPQSYERVADDLVEALNGWLGTLVRRQLTDAGCRCVQTIVGEALDNAERHSNVSTEDGDWSTAGFMTRRGSGKDAEYVCHLSFMSLGATISESLQTAGQKTRTKMSAYVGKHRSLFDRRFTEENLQTVFALQDGVSRVSEAITQQRGGTGLMDVLAFFAGLGGTSPAKTEPTLSIISGSTCILAKAPYVEGIRKADTDLSPGKRAPRELWFNPQNDADVPPDASHVLSLPARLSGTLITMAWSLNPQYLEEASNGH